MNLSFDDIQRVGQVIQTMNQLAAVTRGHVPVLSVQLQSKEQTEEEPNPPSFYVQLVWDDEAQIGPPIVYQYGNSFGLTAEGAVVDPPRKGSYVVGQITNQDSDEESREEAGDFLKNLIESIGGEYHDVQVVDVNSDSFGFAEEPDEDQLAYDDLLNQEAIELDGLTISDHGKEA